jgi:hypothetical protein
VPFFCLCCGNKRTYFNGGLELFLGTPVTKLSDIYTTLGCAHSLQPVPDDDFIPPSIPALTTRGFAIWQTIQLLLDPEEHVPYIQNAVKMFSLRDPETGELFPKEIPAEAFPMYPDQVTERWHDEAFARKNAEKKKKETEEKVKTPHTVVTDVPIVESEEEDWAYRPRRKHRHRHTAYEEPVVYSRSAPGNGAERSSQRHGGSRSHKHHHSYSHPEAYGAGLVVETPVTSDIDEDVYAPRRTRHMSNSRTSRPGHSSSRSRHPSREYLRSSGGGYTYGSGGVVDAATVPIAVPIDPYAQLTVEPTATATYIRPSESHLHGYHSVPSMHYHTPTPQATEDDLRSRFLRHRSSSPPSRAPLGGGGRPRVYVENEYESPGEQYYPDDDLIAEEVRRREKEERRRRRKEEERAYIHAHAPDGWGDAGGGRHRKAAAAAVYYQ